MDAVIELRKVSFAYKKEGPKVLDDISCHMREGRLIAVLGANGAGKSTLFKCMLGLLRRYEGDIFFQGREVRKLSRREMAAIVAYIPQTETPVYNYTVYDTVLMGTTGMLSPMRSPGEEQIRITEEAIRFFGMEDLSNRGIQEISGGERQLALLARAMAQKAKVLIMDEPTANLDYGNQQMVLRRVRQMAEQGYTILLSTHNPEHALRYATDVFAIKDHKVLAEGPASKTIDEELIEALYGLKVKITETEIDGKRVRTCIPAEE